MKSKCDDSLIEFLSRRVEPLRFPAGAPVELDLGCGEGTFAVLLAERYPDRVVLAADVMLGRLRKLCRKSARCGARNVMPLRGEAWRLVGGLLPDASLDRLHMLCPDPWPKDRHKCHRLLSSEFVGQAERVLKKGGCLHVATDDRRYFADAERIVRLSGLFERNDTLIADLAGMTTDFERRFHTLGTQVLHAAWRKTNQVDR